MSTLRSASMLRAAHPHRRTRGAVDEILDAGVGDEATAADHHEMLGGLRHLRQQMARDEDGTALGGQALHELSDPDDALGVEAVTGSSNSSTLGSPSSAPARPSRCDIPSEKPPAFLPATSLRPTRRSTSSTRDIGSELAAAIHCRCAFAERLGCTTLGVEQRADGPQRLLELVVRHTLDQRGSRRRGVESEDHSHGRRLGRHRSGRGSGDDSRLHGEREIVHRSRRP